MGRGRQKAKHTKVARELKYFSPEVDLTALERELVHQDENELIDKWADLFPEAADETSAEDADTDADAATDSADASGDAGSADAGNA
ncbi:MAG: hypothetical protein RL719_17 [Actinomycetota bacterium]